MNRYTSTILLLCLPLLACEPADPYEFEPDIPATELRGVGDATVCVSWGTTYCEINLNGDPCMPGLVDPCDIEATVACVEPITVICEGIFPGETCASGWADACTHGY